MGLAQRLPFFNLLRRDPLFRRAFDETALRKLTANGLIQHKTAHAFVGNGSRGGHSTSIRESLHEWRKGGYRGFSFSGSLATRGKPAR